MGKKNSFSIQYKFIIVMVIIISLTMGVFGFYASKYIKKDKITYVYDLNSSVIHSFALQVDAIFSIRASTIENFIKDYVYAGIDQGSTSESKAIDQLMDRNHDLMLFELVTRKQAKRLFTLLNLKFYQEAELRFLDQKISREIFFDYMQSGKERGVYRVSLSEKSSAIILLYRLQERPEAVAVVAFDMRIMLKELYAQSDVYDIFMVGRSGDLLGHSDPKLFEQAMKGGGKIRNDFIFQAANQNVGRGVGEYFSSLRKEKVLVAYSVVPQWESIIFVEVPQGIAALGAKQLLELVYKTGAIVLVIALLLVVIFSRRMIAPLIQLSKATHHIAEGNFKTKIPVRSKDEIGALAEDFNLMGEKLDALTSQLIKTGQLAALGSLARSVSHEFGNILTGIMGQAELAMMGEDPDEMKVKLQIIVEATEKANDIIQNMKGYYKKDEHPRQAESLAKSLELVSNLVFPEYNKCGHKIEKEYSEDLSVVMDKKEMEQVFLNMLINAGHAMGRDGTLVILLEKSDDGKMAEVRFKDSGCGISKENLPKIFEALFTTKGDKGTGMGLSVSKTIVEQHQGTISVESEEAKGTTFIIRLPLAVVA
ncbi:MAG: sensor histidine kinase [Oligoflexia bacterium]|nr:sensor histidine kinase [Oligoflexia bacterium]